MKQTFNFFTQTFLYDFAKDGGALGDINTGAGCINTGIQLPLAVVVGMCFLIITAPTSAGAPFIRIGNVSNPYCPFQGLPLSTAPNIMTDARGTITPFPVVMAITNATLTGGKFYCFIQYYGPFQNFQ